jgi:cell division septation protein DedD
MTEVRRARWLIALVVITSGALLGLLRWAGRVAAAPSPASEAVADGLPVADGSGTPAPAGAGVDLSFYRALGSGGGARPKNAPPAEGRALRPDPSAFAAPAGAFLVQVMATRDEDQAKRLVDRLARRGYPAAVLSENSGGAPLYRVRVGRYKERVSADAMAGKLRERERLEPWVLQETGP